MSQFTGRKRIHPDLQVMHSIPGRIRLRARKLYGRSRSADDIARKLSGIHGFHTVEVNPVTGSITMSYHHSVVDSVVFFAEVAAVLGLIAEGIDPSAVEAWFKLVGVPPEEVARSPDRQHFVLPIATFTLGVFIGLKLV